MIHELHQDCLGTHSLMTLLGVGIGLESALAELLILQMF